MHRIVAGNITTPGNRRPKRKPLSDKKADEAKGPVSKPKKKTSPLPLKEVYYECATGSTAEVRQKSGATESSVQVNEASAIGIVMAKKASLKDLCLEDKQRIANLVKELAR